MGFSVADRSAVAIGSAAPVSAAHGLPLSDRILDNAEWMILVFIFKASDAELV
jgi:hypothetical protein